MCKKTFIVMACMLVAFLPSFAQQGFQFKSFEKSADKALYVSLVEQLYQAAKAGRIPIYATGLKEKIPVSQIPEATRIKEVVPIYPNPENPYEKYDSVMHSPYSTEYIRGLAFRRKAAGIESFAPYYLLREKNKKEPSPIPVFWVMSKDAITVIGEENYRKLEKFMLDNKKK